MSPKRRKESSGCRALEELKRDGKLRKPELLAHTTAGEDSSSFKPSTLHLVWIETSVGKSPCEVLKRAGDPCPPTCRLVATKVPDEERAEITWDIYLMNCHYGPPCDLFEVKGSIKKRAR